MDLFFGIILGLFSLVILVVLHELGHAIAAIRSGVVVEEFGIGLPPRAWKKKLKNGLLFTINWLPLGGFVKLKGEYDAADKKGDYGAATFWQKTKILLAGVTANWLVAAILLTGLSLTGMPKILNDQFSIASDTKTVLRPVEIIGLSKDHAAQNAGLKVGDKIIRFAGQEVPTTDSLIALSKASKGKKVEVIYDRNGTEYNVWANIGNGDAGGYFGAQLGQRELIKATWSAPIVGIVTTAQFTAVTFDGIGQVFTNLVGGIIAQLSPDDSVKQQASDDLKMVGDSVAGPIGILGTIFPQARQQGATQFVFLTAIISISLAVMNVLPIPALDGGRWMMIIAFKLMKKKLTREREEKLQTIGFTALMGLVVLVTIVDVAKLF